MLRNVDGEHWIALDVNSTECKTDSNPLLRGLRGDPRYSALLAKMNLPPD